MTCLRWSRVHETTTDAPSSAAENAGGSPLIANRDSVGLWEEFDLVTD